MMIGSAVAVPLQWMKMNDLRLLAASTIGIIGGLAALGFVSKAISFAIAIVVLGISLGLADAVSNIAVAELFTPSPAPFLQVNY